MTLKEYLKKYGISLLSITKQSGIDYQILLRMQNPNQSTSLLHALNLVYFLNNEVNLEALLNDKERKLHKAFKEKIDRQNKAD